MLFISSVILIYLFSSLELWVLYCTNQSSMTRGETCYRGNYEVMMAKSFPHQPNKKLGKCHLILAVVHCHILLTAVRVRFGGLS